MFLGTRTALDRAGVGVKLWPFAVKHWCFAENSHLYDGSCAYFKRFGEFSKHKDIPFGALVNFLPPKSLAEKLPKFDTPGIPGIMMGYRTHPGGKWTGDYKISPVCDWDLEKTTTQIVRCFSIKEVILPENGKWKFPLRKVLYRETRRSSALRST